MKDETTTASQRGEITQLLQAWVQGEKGAESALVNTIYTELRKMADSYLRGERSSHTLQPTALVHEAYLRLVNQRSAGLGGRRQFFALASKMMRRILVDHARRRASVKRGSGMTILQLNADLADFSSLSDPALTALDSALESLAKLDPSKAQMVELRFFGGLTVKETAEILEISEATVYREWRLTRAWLFKTVGKGPYEGDGRER